MAKRSKKKKRAPAASVREASPWELSTQWWIFIKTLLIAALVTWIFWPALHGTWLWDDFVYIPQNTLMGDPARLWKTWFSPGSFIEYYPIEQSVEWAQWELFHNATLGYHVTNIILHFLSALLVWRLLAKFGLRLAWLGGLLFAIHPTAVESVAWMSELKNTLSLPFFLLAACAYMDYDERRRTSDYLWSIVLFLVAMLCKISMAPFPLIILLFAWWKRGRIGRDDIKSAAPFFVISLVLGLTTIMSGIWFRPAHHMLPDHVVVGGLFARLDLIGLLSAWYTWQVVRPVAPSFFYPKWTVDPPTLWQFLPWPIFAGLFYFLWARRKSWGRHALLALGFFFINLSPFLGLTTPSYMQYTWAMDHMLYLPIIGLIGLAVAGMGLIDQRISRKVRFWAVAALVAAIGALTISSHRYAATFTDDVTLWAHTTECDPNSATTHENWGFALMNRGRFEEAIAQFYLAEKIAPHQEDIHINLGLALAQTGRLKEALEEFDAAIRADPQSVNAYSNRGHLWQIMGNEDKSLADLNRALELNPDMPLPYLHRSIIRRSSGDWHGQLSDLQTFCRLAPGNRNAAYAHFEIWTVLAQHGQRAEADRELALALQNSWSNPSDSWPTQIARFLLGQISESEFLAAAVSPDPDQDREQHCEAWYFDGMMHLQAGDKSGARDCFQHCLASGLTKSTAYQLASLQLSQLK